MMVNARRCRFIVNEALSDVEIARIYLIKASRRRWEPGRRDGREDEDLSYGSLPALYKCFAIIFWSVTCTEEGNC